MREPDWNNPNLNIGDLYRPAMEITTQEEASRYLYRLVTYVIAHAEEKDKKGLTFDDHVRIQKSNLGYFAGYFDSRTMERVNRVFNTAHPVFGRTAPTLEEAFNARKEFAKTGKMPKSKEQQGSAQKRKVRSVILD
jgi:hypothetical protein